MKKWFKEQWPAIVASLGFGALAAIALILVVNHWEYIKHTF